MTQNAMESDNRNQQTSEDLKQTRNKPVTAKFAPANFGQCFTIMRHLSAAAKFFFGTKTTPHGSQGGSTGARPADRTGSSSDR